MNTKSLLLSMVALSLWVPGSASAQDEKPWTFLVYGAADNNADGPILGFLDSVRVALDDDPGVELLLLIDRHVRYSDDEKFLGEDFEGTRLYRLKKDHAERLSGEGELPQIKLDGDCELDTADPAVLGQFIAWAKMNHPARRYGLMIYSHANGRSMCPDEDAGHDMGIAELGAAVDESVDFAGLELCNMAGLEIAYEWRPKQKGFSADVMVAIPNAGPPLDWDRAFARVRSKGHASTAAEPHLDPETMTAADLGKLVVAEGWLGRQAAGKRDPDYVKHEAAVCFDMKAVEPVKKAVDALAVALATSNARDAFFEARTGGPDGAVINYDGDGPYVDLFDLSRRLAANAKLPEPVRTSARDVISAMEPFVLASFGGSSFAGFQPGKSGTFIVMPSNEPGRWKDFGWYSPKPSVDGKTALGGWSFLQDGMNPGNGKVDGWFELLDSWLDDAKDGGVNGYVP